LKPFLLNVVICDQNIRETALTNFLEHCRGFEDPLYFLNVKKRDKKKMKKMCIHLFFKGAVIVTKVIIVFFCLMEKHMMEKIMGFQLM
jgi:hypothetical protein